MLRPNGNLKGGATEDQERNELLDALIERLRGEGLPAGSWLVEIGQARLHLASIDGLLRKLEAAIVAGMQPP